MEHLIEVILLYSTDAWHSHSSMRLEGVFSDQDALHNYLNQMKLSGELTDYDLQMLAEQNQTQGRDTNYLIETKKTTQNMKDKINLFHERAALLRSELTSAIIGILKDNNLSEINLSQNAEKVPWVVWFDNRNYGYDSRVTKVLLDGNGIAVEVYDQDCCCTATMTSDQSDLACTNIDWLVRILACINYTLGLPKSAGIAEIAGHIIEWSYEEPGLPELPEEELLQIENNLQKGEREGCLLYDDDNDMTFAGTWKIKSN